MVATWMATPAAWQWDISGSIALQEALNGGKLHAAILLHDLIDLRDCGSLLSEIHDEKKDLI